MKITKILAATAVMLLMTVMAVTMLIPVSAAADKTAVISDVQAFPGETVSIDVRMNGTQISAYSFDISYNVALFRLDAVSSELDNFTMHPNANGFRAVWFGSGSMAMDDTVIMTIMLTVNPVTSPDIYRIYLSADQAFNGNDPVDLTVMNGSITVKDATNAPTLTIVGGSTVPGEPFTVNVKMTSVTLITLKMSMTFPKGYLSISDIDMGLSDAVYNIEDNKLTVAWYSAGEALAMNGTIFTVTLMPFSTISAITIPIAAEIDHNETFDHSNNKISINIIQGAIKVVAENTLLDIPSAETIIGDIRSSEMVVYNIDPSSSASMSLDCRVFDDLTEGRSLTFVIKDGDVMLYSWTFSGTSEGPKKGNSVMSDLDLRVSLSPTPSEAMAKVIEDIDIRKSCFITLEGSGDLPYNGMLSIYVRDITGPGTELSFRYLNSGSLDVVASVTVSDQGYVELPISHFSEYALLDVDGNGDDGIIWIVAAAVAIFVVVTVLAAIWYRMRKRGG